MLAELGRLVILFLLLPIFLLLLGPFLVLAVIKGRQPFGPVTLDTSDYGPAGRLAALLVGLFLWGLAWGGLAWLGYNAFTPPTVATLPAASPAPATAALPVMPTASSTPPPAPTATALPTPVPSLTPTPTPSPSPLPTRTPTPVPTSTATAVVVVTPTGEPASTPASGLSAAEKAAAIETVIAANRLLQQAVSQVEGDPSPLLEPLWQDVALTAARIFSGRIHKNFAPPVQVQFEFIHPPQVDPQSTAGRIVVTTRERWQYGRPNRLTVDETFDFTYILVPADSGWVIQRYSYRNLSSPTPAATPSEG